MKTEEIRLTDLETKLLHDISRDQQFWAETDFVSSWAFHTAQLWSGKVNQLSGVISSLIKKGIMTVDIYPGEEDLHGLSEAGQDFIHRILASRG